MLAEPPKVPASPPVPRQWPSFQATLVLWVSLLISPLGFSPPPQVQHEGQNFEQVLALQPRGATEALQNRPSDIHKESSPRTPPPPQESAPTGGNKLHVMCKCQDGKSHISVLKEQRENGAGNEAASSAPTPALSVQVSRGALGQCLLRDISGTPTQVLSPALLPSHVHSSNARANNKAAGVAGTLCSHLWLICVLVFSQSLFCGHCGHPNIGAVVLA